MNDSVPRFLLSANEKIPSPRRLGRYRLSFIDRTMAGIATMVKTGYLQGGKTTEQGPLHRLDARIKVVFMLSLIVLISIKTQGKAGGVIAVCILVLALVARINLFRLYRRVLAFAFLFGFLIALPSALNIVREGELLVTLVRLDSAHRWWIYTLPREIGLTREGVYGVGLLTLRVMNSLAITFLLLATTRFPDVVKALRVLGAPDVFLLVLTLSHKYIFIFAQIITDSFMAIRARFIGAASVADMQNMMAGRAVFMFNKTRQACEDTYRAMQARGYTGRIAVQQFHRINVHDVAWAATFLIVDCIILMV